jgi:iron complex transport system ATP-binding protein
VILEIENVSVALSGVTVLDAVSARVDQGSWLGVVGPNGAGKTTLLRAVAGLVSYEGKIRVAGRVPNVSRRREVARLVSYVPQRPVIPQAMLVTDYIMLGRSAHHSYLGAPTRRDRQVVAAVLERLELTAFAGRPLGQVSGGECQRVVLARALAQEAPVLVMDEPTASLDLGHGQLVLELADELRRERSLCVLCALHDLTFAAQYSDRLLVLADGRVVACGSASEVLTQESVEEIFEASVEIIDGKSGIAVTPVRPDHQGLSAVPLKRREA